MLIRLRWYMVALTNPLEQDGLKSWTAEDCDAQQDILLEVC